MKRKLAWVLVAAVLGAAVVIILWPGQAGTRPKIELSLLGFSNSPTGSEAIFAVHLHPYIGGHRWNAVEVDRWEEGGWKHVVSQRPGIQFYTPPSPRSLTNGRRVDVVARYPLPNTNDSWRFRMHINEGPLLGPVFIQLCRDLGNRLRRKQSRLQTEVDYSYWVTNEVHPAITH